MEYYLDYNGYEKYLITRYTRWDMDGVGYIFKFDNNYGASVVKNRYSYGGRYDKWEVAVLYFTGEEAEPGSLCDEDYELDYDTPITNDVLGWLDDSEVRVILRRIQLLHSKK